MNNSCYRDAHQSHQEAGAQTWQEQHGGGNDV